MTTRLPKLRPRAVRCLALVLTLAGCGGSSDAPAPAELSAQAALGLKIFNDASLSASGRQSCASCHVAAAGHAQDNALAAQLGGVGLSLQGNRVSPSIRYLSFATAFFVDAGGTPSGGLFWDGRASSLADQAGRPFLNPVEMALASEGDLVVRLASAGYAAEFRQVFGADIFERAHDAFESVKMALQQFQREDPSLRPFSSKYDAFLRGKATLSDQEARGLALFNDATKGNCASCHPSAVGRDGSFPLFTNFTYHALGIPRNLQIEANADPAHFDLGLCAREGGDLLARADLCGAFKVPSLRNVSLRQALFHNGRFKRLDEAVSFYAERDTDPAKFYPRKADGSIDAFDDLPEVYKGNVTRGEAPYDRRAGQAPALSRSEIDDVVSFLRALTDGWKP